jgi:hypothetical protein
MTFFQKIKKSNSEAARWNRLAVASRSQAPAPTLRTFDGVACSPWLKQYVQAHPEASAAEIRAEAWKAGHSVQTLELRAEEQGISLELAR